MWTLKETRKDSQSLQYEYGCQIKGDWERLIEVIGAKRDRARLRETKDTKEDREKCIETMGTERDGVRLRETILCGYQRRLVETQGTKRDRARLRQNGRDSWRPACVGTERERLCETQEDQECQRSRERLKQIWV